MKIKLVFFDCDGVLTTGDPWLELHRLLSIPLSVDIKWWHDYYNAKVSYKAWVKYQTDIYHKKRLHYKTYLQAMKVSKIVPEAYEVIEYFKSKNIRTAIISSGIDYYVRKTALKLKTDYWRVNNRFIFNKAGYFKKFAYDTNDPQAKVIHIKEILQLTKILRDESIFIGDDINDREAFKYLKHGILLLKENNKNLKNYVWKTIERLKEIINIIK